MTLRPEIAEALDHPSYRKATWWCSCGMTHTVEFAHAGKGASILRQKGVCSGGLVAPEHELRPMILVRVTSGRS